MPRDDYLIGMRRRIADLDFRIGLARDSLADTEVGADRRAAVTESLDELQERRAQMIERLDDLELQPDGTWVGVRDEVEQEWDALSQDFEERIGRLM